MAHPAGGYAIHELGDEVYLLRSGESDFHRNIYLKRFVGSGAPGSMIFDPGTRLDIPGILPALKKLIGGVENLEMVFLSHQDPDVSANVSALLAGAPRAILVTSIDTWRLVRMYGVSENRFFAIENMKSDPVRLKRTGHRVSFVPIPFVHFKGAMMVYDLESDVLFSGDFLGGLTTRSGAGIFGDDSSWKGISLFHQLYMPCNQAILNAVGRIGMLPKTPRLVAPQHGDVLPGSLAAAFLERLTRINVGLDIHSETQRGDILLPALNAFLHGFRAAHGEAAEAVLQALRQPGEFTTFFTVVDDAILDIKVSAAEAVPLFWESVRRLLPASLAAGVAASFLDTMEEFGLPVGEKLAAEIKPPFAAGDVFG